MENQFTQDTPLTELEQLRMKATLTSCTRPEYGEVTIPFPIPDEEYDHTMDLLRGLDIGDTLAQDCQIVRVESPHPILTKLEGTVVNVDELDYLARRMNCLYGDEETQFFAMAHNLTKIWRIFATTGGMVSSASNRRTEALLSTAMCVLPWYAGTGGIDAGGTRRAAGNADEWSVIVAATLFTG